MVFTRSIVGVRRAPSGDPGGERWRQLGRTPAEIAAVDCLGGGLNQRGSWNGGAHSRQKETAPTTVPGPIVGDQSFLPESNWRPSHYE